MTRPADFDDRLLSYRPMLKRMASRLVPTDDREDLVQSAVARAIEKWADCRDGFSSWLRLIVLAEYNNYRNAKRLGPANDNVQPATQEDVVAANQVLAKCRHPGVMLAVGMGASMEEIAAERGITKQAISRKVREDRKRIARA